MLMDINSELGNLEIIFEGEKRSFEFPGKNLGDVQFWPLHYLEMRFIF